MQDYKTWIASRLDMVGPLGDLARIIHTDPNFPDSSEREEILQWLSTRPEYERLKIAFIGTWKFYVADAKKKPREASLENKLVHEVEKRGGLCWKFTSPGTVGVPDRIVLAPGGKVAFVEMKAPGKKLRPIQHKRAEQIMGLGVLYYCLNSYQGILDFMQEMFGDEV